MEARERARSWRTIAGPDVVLERLHREQLVLFYGTRRRVYSGRVRVFALRKELGVTMPERIHEERPGWFGCERCAQNHKAAVRKDAPAVFEANGLQLVGPCRGEYVPQACTCAGCGSLRSVAYAELVAGTARLCWTCTHGIRADEPHRVYLVRFQALGVLKVGLTHNRHDRRLFQHELEGGTVVESIVVPDRATARSLERWIIADASCLGRARTRSGRQCSRRAGGRRRGRRQVPPCCRSRLQPRTPASTRCGREPDVTVSDG